MKQLHPLTARQSARQTAAHGLVADVISVMATSRRLSQRCMSEIVSLKRGNSLATLWTWRSRWFHPALTLPNRSF